MGFAKWQNFGGRLRLIGSGVAVGRLLIADGGCTGWPTCRVGSALAALRDELATCGPTTEDRISGNLAFRLLDIHSLHRTSHESRNVLQMFLAAAAVLVPDVASDGDTHAVRFPDESEGIQAGESRHWPPHASLFAEQRAADG